jgi:hypothetical protein
MAIKHLKRRRRIDTLFNKAYELGKYDYIDVAVLLHHNGCTSLIDQLIKSHDGKFASEMNRAKI